MARRNPLNDATDAASPRPSSGPRAAPRARRGAPARNTVRIIGGQWRGRRLRFPDVAGLRPTPDRVRETLFNWLAPVIRGARCLDLFAGSGALGFEALSRGATRVTLVERNQAALQALRDAAAVLQAGDRAGIVPGTAEAYLATAAGPFDVIFLDPPFDAHALPAMIATIAHRGLVSSGGFVYLETPADEPLPPLPPGWRVHRSGRAGDVGYHLAVCSGATTGGENGRAVPALCETITPRRSHARSDRGRARGRGTARTPDRLQEE